jgi:hypothetical protein
MTAARISEKQADGGSNDDKEPKKVTGVAKCFFRHAHLPCPVRGAPGWPNRPEAFGERWRMRVVERAAREMSELAYPGSGDPVRKALTYPA